MRDYHRTFRATCPLRTILGFEIAHEGDERLQSVIGAGEEWTVTVQLEIIGQWLPVSDGDIVLTEAEENQLAGTLIELLKLIAVLGLTKIEATQ